MCIAWHGHGNACTPSNQGIQWNYFLSKKRISDFFDRQEEIGVGFLKRGGDMGSQIG